MKNLCYLIFLAIIGVSCNEVGEVTFGDMNAEKDDEKSTPVMAGNSEEVQHHYKYNCIDHCDGSGEECTMSINVQQGYVECNCEGCTLVVEVVDPEDGSSQTINAETEAFGASYKQMMDKLLKKNMYLNFLEEFVQEKFSTSYYEITAIELVEAGENYGIIYDFKTDNEIEESVMYVWLNSLGEEEGQTYEIDCHGSCDTPEETCRERFTFNPPAAECTCESNNCTMTVKET